LYFVFSLSSAIVGVNVVRLVLVSATVGEYVGVTDDVEIVELGSSLLQQNNSAASIIVSHSIEPCFTDVA
jgi:hypothetical protein